MLFAHRLRSLCSSSFASFFLPHLFSPLPNTTTADQLASSRSENDTQLTSRLEFLVATSGAIVELLAVPMYYTFFIRPSRELITAAQAAAASKAGTNHSDAGSSILSPKRVASKDKRDHPSSSALRHPFHFATLAFLAHHPYPEVSRRFIDKVFEMIRRAKLTYSVFASVIALCANHEDSHFVEQTKKSLM